MQANNSSGCKESGESVRNSDLPIQMVQGAIEKIRIGPGKIGVLSNNGGAGKYGK